MSSFNEKKNFWQKELLMLNKHWRGGIEKIVDLN